MADELADLKRELAEIKAALPASTSAVSEQAAREFQDQMHQMRERRANAVPQWLIDQTIGGVSNADARDIALRDGRAPTGPSGQGVVPSSQQLTGVHPGGGGRGWAHEVPIGPPAGINYVDCIVEADTARQRAELARKLKP